MLALFAIIDFLCPMKLSTTNQQLRSDAKAEELGKSQVTFSWCLAVRRDLIFSSFQKLIQ